MRRSTEAEAPRENVALEGNESCMGSQQIHRPRTRRNRLGKSSCVGNEKKVVDIRYT